jgi:membrane associated rhomboid family serine protease
MGEYRGTSGLAVMMAVLWGALKWPGASGGGRLMLAALACALAAKLVAEAFGRSMGLAGLPQDVAVAWQAHLVGALCAAALAARHCRARTP